MWLSNICKYKCSNGTEGIATHFIFIYDFIIILEYVIECVFAVEGHIILKIW
jgi:hypothetical protein